MLVKYSERDFSVAQAIFSKLSDTALTLARERESVILSLIGTELYLLILHIERHSEQVDQSFHTRLKEVLSVVESIYEPSQKVSSSRDKSTNVFEISNHLYKDMVSGKTIRDTLLAHDKAHAALRKSCNISALSINPLTKLHRALRALNGSFTESEAVAKRKIPLPPNDYPAHVNSELYKTLESYSKCSCSQAITHAGSQHYIRLNLRPESSIFDEDVSFIVLFSGSSYYSHETLSHWQQIRFLLSSKQFSRKRQVMFDDQLDQLQQPTKDMISNDMKLIDTEDFCHLLNADLGPARICARVKNGNILKYPDREEGNPFGASESISLANVLLKYRLTGRDKLVLAYILSYSAWKYYNSDWMKAKWSLESIHFLREEKADDVAHGDLEIYASDPCFAVDFQGSNNNVLEFYDGDVAHRYPRLLALGILLLNIGRRRPLIEQSYSSADKTDQQINNNCALSLKTLNRDENWPDLGTLQNAAVKAKYKEIVLACFDKRLFIDSIARGAKTKSHAQVDNLQDVEERRNIVYEKIVAPFEDLLESLDWKRSIRYMKPITKSWPETLRSTNTPPLSDKISSSEYKTKALFANSSQVKSSSKWLEHVQNLYRPIYELHQHQISRQFYSRTRIAILDTGYDPSADFFVDPNRQARLKGWRDWAAGSETPKDDDGHGSTTLSMLMKLAPMADLYVARVARNSEELKDSIRSIASAITWAATVCKAHIISMSFGFDEEVNQDDAENDGLVSVAIHQAVTERREEILFFAAAGNEGANLKRVMFPARHDLVIPIYGTSANGVFLEHLNPRIRPDEPAIFGTLAEDIPCWDAIREDEVLHTGTSYATAIAAGLAGMLLEYVQLLEDKKHGGQAYRGPWRAHLCKRRGMLSLFQNIAEIPPDRRYYIHPIHFFRKHEKAREACIINALENSS